MNVHESDISRAVAVFRSSPNLPDLELYRALVQLGFERSIAARIVEFLPSIYCRVILKDSGLVFADDYERKDVGNKKKRFSLLADPLSNALMAFAKDECAVVSRNDIFIIAARSAEFDAANRLLSRGSKLKDIRFTPIFFPWPESGPE